MACLLTYGNNKVATELAAQKLAENWKARNPDECSEDSVSPMLENLDDSLTSLNWLQNMNINLEQSTEKSNMSSESSIQDQTRSSDISSNDCEANEEENRPQEIDYKTDTNHKPPYSYATLICMAMKESKKSKITLSAIYNWIRENFMYYRIADPSWQNSIRHNLSLNKCFAKVPRKKDEPGKGGFWKIDPAHADMFVDGIFRKRRSCKENKSCNQIKKKIRVLSNSNDYCEGGVMSMHQTCVLKASDNTRKESTDDLDQSIVSSTNNRKKKQQLLHNKSDRKKTKNHRCCRQQGRNYNSKGINSDAVHDCNKTGTNDHQKKKKTDLLYTKKRKNVIDIKHKKKLTSKQSRRIDQRVPESKLREESDEAALDDILERNFNWDTFFDEDTALSCNSLSPGRSSHESVDPSLFNISSMSDFQLSPPMSHINCCDDEFTTEDYIPEILPTDDPDVELMVRGFSCFPSSLDTYNDPLLGANNNQDWQDQQKSTQESITELLADPWSETKDGSDLFQNSNDMRSINSVVLL